MYKVIIPHQSWPTVSNSKCWWAQIARQGTVSVYIRKFDRGTKSSKNVLLSTVHANQQDNNNMSTEGKYAASYVGKEMTVALLWSLTWFMGITVPFLKKWDMSQWGREWKGVGQGGRGEMPGLDITRHKSLSQDSEALAWSQRENEEEGKERSWKGDIGRGLRRTSAINYMKKMCLLVIILPLFVVINLVTHRRCHYPGRCDALQRPGSKKGMSKILRGCLRVDR